MTGQWRTPRCLSWQIPIIVIGSKVRLVSTICQSFDVGNLRKTGNDDLTPLLPTYFSLDSL